MIRRTSKNTYEQVVAEGLVSGLQFQIYQNLYKHICERNQTPLTQNEIWKRWFSETHHPNSITPRFAELEAKGLLWASGERECQVTGRVALVWETTDNLPVKPPPRPTSKEIIKAKDEEIARLKRVICNLQDLVQELEGSKNEVQISAHV